MPVWVAQFVMVIASKTGWKESYILHEVPLARAYAYYHAARLMEGERCRWPGGQGPVDRYVDEVREWVGRRRVIGDG